MILPLVLGPLHASSVIDIGCGQGAWLAAAGALGATRLTGLDGPWVDEARLRHPGIRFVPTNLAADAPITVERHDVAISVEVAEHLPAPRAAALVHALCDAADAVVFSAAVPHQGGTDHVNERRASYWASLFAERGFECLDIVRGAVWNDEHVEWWYRQNVLVFARRGSAAHRALDSVPPPPRPLDLVHPDAFESKMAYLLPHGGSGTGARGWWSRPRPRMLVAFIAGLAVGALAVAWVLMRTP